MATDGGHGSISQLLMNVDLLVQGSFDFESFVSARFAFLGTLIRNFRGRISKGYICDNM